MKKFTLIFIIGILLSFNSYAQACDYKIEVLADGDDFESRDFKWRMKATKIEGKSTNITGTAEIEDSNGKTVKSYKPWTSDSIAKQKTSSEYSPNLKPGSYKITAEISVECDDTNKDNNVAKKEIKIKGEAEEAKGTKSKSEDAADNEAKNLKPATIDENKENAITAKTQKTAAREESDNTIELKPQNTEENIQEQQIITSNIMQNPENTETVYESSGERAKHWILIFLLTLSILLNIVLVWRR